MKIESNIISEDFKKRLNEALTEVMNKSYTQLKKELRIKRQVEKFIKKQTH